MDALFKLAFTIAAGIGDGGSFGNRVRRLAATALGALTVGIFVAAAIGCTGASLWIFAIPYVGPAGAPLAVASVFLVLGLASLVLIRSGKGRSRIPPPSSASADKVLADVARLLQDRKGATLMTAFMAGLAAASDRR